MIPFNMYALTTCFATLYIHAGLSYENNFAFGIRRRSSGHVAALFAMSWMFRAGVQVVRWRAAFLNFAPYLSATVFRASAMLRLH